jgi:hypothetical protein
MMGSKFSNDHVRIYTMGLERWVPSFEIIESIHDGKWKLSERESFKWWGDGVWLAEQNLKRHRWECD